MNEYLVAVLRCLSLHFHVGKALGIRFDGLKPFGQESFAEGKALRLLNFTPNDMYGPALGDMLNI